MDRFNGKKIVIFAHSMGTANGGAAGQGIPENKTYGGLLRDLNNCIIYRDAIAGARISAPTTYPTRMTNPARWNTLDSVIPNPNIILIDAAINDFLQNVELGLPTDTEINTFYGATDYLLKNIVPRYPDTRVFWKLPCHTSYQTASFPEKNSSGVYLTSFVNIIKEVCLRYGVTVIDSFQNSGMTHANTSTYTIDGIHHNELGARTEYETIRNAFNACLTYEYADNTNEEEPQTSSIVFDIKSNNIANITYNETTNVLEAQTNSGNYDFALTDDLNSAVVMMPVANPVGLPAFVIGNDSQGNAIVLYTDGSGKISNFKKSGLVSEITQITVLDGLKPTAAKGAYVTITHGTESVNISYGSYSRDIPYTLIPDLAVKSIGCLFTGAGVSNYIFDKIN